METMEKIPFTFATLLPTISPAAQIAVYEAEQKKGLEELYRGVAIKARDNEKVMASEVRLINMAAVPDSVPLLEIYVIT